MKLVQPRFLQDWAALQWAMIALALLSGIFLCWKYGPEPVAQQMFAHSAEVEAVPYAEHLIASLENGGKTFQTGIVTETDVRTLKTIALTQGFYKLILRDSTGRAFWSNRSEEIGQVSSDATVVKVLEEGKYSFAHIHAPDSDVFSRPENSVGSGSSIDHDGRDVSYLVVPAKVDAELVGLIESYQDVTEINNAFILTIRWTFAIIGGIVGSVGLVSIYRMQRAAKLALATSRALSDVETSSLSAQLRVGREVRLLGELNEWLQSSKSLDELFYMVTRFMSHLLPGAAGSIYVYSNSRDVLDGAVSWNGGVKRPQIHPEDCWGLRRGRTYSYAEGEVQFKCGHAHDEESRNYICIPFLAHGETVGMMHLAAHANISNEEFAVLRKLAQMCAEQISLAIANVRMRDELHHQAIRDVLTGLFNRRHMMDTLRRRIETRKAEKFSIVSIDVDHFKKFNDNHGHDAGDLVLRNVAETMIAACDGSEIACRMGGEELMLLLPEISIDDAIARADALRIAISEIVVRYGDKNLPQITISIGVSEYPTHGGNPLDVIRAADEALYLAKDNGRNCVIKAGEASQTVFDPLSNAVLAEWEADRVGEGSKVG